MDKKFLLDISLSLILILILVISVPPVITGFASSQIDLSIEGSTDVEILLFDYDPIITFSPYEYQNITVNILNSGSEDYMAKIELYVYFFEDAVLKEVAHYQDTEVNLTKGMKRFFSSTFVATKQGFYYIKLKVSYGTKRKDVWRSFYAGSG